FGGHFRFGEPHTASRVAPQTPPNAKTQFFRLRYLAVAWSLYRRKRPSRPHRPRPNCSGIARNRRGRCFGRGATRRRTGLIQRGRTEMVGGSNTSPASRPRACRALRCAAIVLAMFAWGAACRAAGERPNILVLLADDLGYSDTSPFGGEMSTPNL